jgi:hypothetical protein
MPRRSRPDKSPIGPIVLPPLLAHVIRTAEKQFSVAVSRIDCVDQRGAIETAHANIVNVSELAHYYAGLAAGITLAEVGRIERISGGSEKSR